MSTLSLIVNQLESISTLRNTPFSKVFTSIQYPPGLSLVPESVPDAFY